MNKKYIILDGDKCHNIPTGTMVIRTDSRTMFGESWEVKPIGSLDFTAQWVSIEHLKEVK